MAQSLYPELHRGCAAFMRHKDVMLSPQMLRTYGVRYTMVRRLVGGEVWRWGKGCAGAGVLLGGLLCYF